MSYNEFRPQHNVLLGDVYSFLLSERDEGVMAGGFGGGPGGGRFHFSDTENKPDISRKMLLRIAKYFTPYWKLLLLLVIFIIMTSILGLIPPLLTKNIIDVALPNKKLNLLVIFISLFLAPLF